MRVYSQKRMGPFAASHVVQPIMNWQRPLGNQRVQRALLANADALDVDSNASVKTSFAHDFSRIPVHANTSVRLQTKLNISTPGDSYEREADQISAQIMGIPERQLQPPCSCGGTCSKCQSEPTGDERLQSNPSRTNDLMEDAPPIIGEALRSSGRPLDSDTRAFMEPRFGHNFADVQVHTDANAALAARSLNAQAFTVGKDVFFGAGQFTPGNSNARATLAHELAHVIQQQSAAPMIARQSSSWGEKLDALWSAGPIDALRASKLADEALAAAKQTGLPGIHNGPADAWRHCYWNCRMVQVIGADDAEDIATNHEEHGENSTAERMMDTWNNEAGRNCSGNCDSCCQSKLDAGRLWVLYDGDTKVGASKPTPRTGTPSGEKYDAYPPQPKERNQIERGFKI